MPGISLTFQILSFAHWDKYPTHGGEPDEVSCDIPLILANSLSLTNLIIEVHMEDCANADWRNANDEVLDPYAVSLEGDKEADLRPRCFVEVALGKLEDGVEDHADGHEDREENPVELVEKSKVGAAFDNQATFSVLNQKCPMGACLKYLPSIMQRRAN